MRLKKNENSKKTAGIAVLLIVGIAMAFFVSIGLNDQEKSGPNKTDQTATTTQKQESTKQTITLEDGSVQGYIENKPLLDYKLIKKDEQLKNLMHSRKKTLGVDSSLDMIVNSDEKFKVGNTVVSMQDILKKAHAKKGTLYQEKIHDSGEVVPATIQTYGVYVVQPKDNLWNIHFNLLKDFYAKKGIDISSKADEPTKEGLSTGVGKILKFSETMVMIYNLVDEKIATNIDLLDPLSKVVIYNMDEVFKLLSEVNYENIDRLQFDGRTIWIPATKDQL